MTKLRFSIAVLLAAFLLAGCGGSSSPAVELPPPSGPDPVQLAAAKDAAKTAWEIARDALAGVAGKASANPAAYQRAVNALADAETAYDAAKAATTVAEAEDARDDAQDASMAALEQVAMVEASFEAPALETAKMAAMSAADAAKMAYEAAKAALADIEAIKSDDMTSYDMAAAQVAAAKAAYDAAKAASDAAAATSDLADARAQQQTAEAELAKANAANADAMKYAGMVQTAADNRMEAENEAEEQRQADVAEARGMAMQSYVDADADATKAEAEADAAETGDPGSEVAALAREAADAARAAAVAAKAALDAITDDMTKADADAKAAEAATAAGTANSQYLVAENLNSGIQAIVEANEQQRQMEVAAARTLAMESYTDADADAMKAEAAADAAETGDPGSAGAIAARAAATAARAAADAAKAAHDAIMDDMTKADADTEAAKAAAAAGTANSQYMTAKAANDEIQRVITAEDDEEQRQMDVATARTAAMESYVDAEADAVKAEAAAEAAEATAPNSPGAMAARTAATAARDAATAAKAAHDAITDTMNKAEADAKAAEAATKADEANSQYDMAKRENDAVQTASAITEEALRAVGIATAKSAASAAVTAAETARDEAAQAAVAAETARDNARAALARAMAARTGVEEAMAQSEAAETAATAARAAATAAETAYDAAKAAADGIDDDGTAEAARMAQATAEQERDNAQAAEMTAGMQQTAAETAEMAAMEAVGTHVLRLFMAANGAHVMDADTTTDVNEAAVAHVTSVGAAMAAIANADEGAQAGPTATTATATWPGDTVDNPVTSEDDSAEGMFSITVTVAGTAIESELRASRAATDLNGDGDTTDPGEGVITQTARQIADLGVFRGYDLWEDDGDATTTDRARAIVFTDKQKGDDSVLAVTPATARSVVGLEFDNANVAELSTVTSAGTTITGVTWTPDGETALTGTLSCTTGCSITLGENGAVTNIQGYSFTGSRAARESADAAPAAEDNNYLAFGLWLDEADDGADTFGAFAVGGAAAGAPPVALTGTATYSGKAAGAHHRTGDGVNWFDGDARLTANFGTATEDGTISGAISNIRVAGGAAMSTPLYLGQADLTAGTATFDGAAFMGAATAPGASTHEFDGTWSGSFFGPSAEVAADADNNIEAVAAGALAPGSVAGTFGVTKSEGTGEDIVVESFVGAFGAHKE